MQVIQKEQNGKLGRVQTQTFIHSFTRPEEDTFKY